MILFDVWERQLSQEPEWIDIEHPQSLPRLPRCAPPPAAANGAAAQGDSARRISRQTWSSSQRRLLSSLLRTIGPPPKIIVDPRGSRRDHRAKYGCLSARPRVRCLCPQDLLTKSVFDRLGSDRWNLASTTFPDAEPMVRIRFPPARSLRTIGS